MKPTVNVRPHNINAVDAKACSYDYEKTASGNAGDGGGGGGNV